jgi:hypothetical protein
MARPGLILVVLAARVASARAEIAVEGTVPFTAAELAFQLALRGATTNDIVVRMVAPAVVELRTAVGIQRVALRDARGTAAARLIALQLATLGVESELIAGPVERATPNGPSRWTFGIAAGGGRGIAALDFTLSAVRVDAVEGRGRWCWGASVAWLHGLARTPDGTYPVTADLFPVRVVAGLAIGPLQVVVGPELVAYSVGPVSGRWTAGAGGSARVRFVDRAAWSATASVDLDGFVHRVLVERAGVVSPPSPHMPFAATPHFTITAAVGLVWGRS